MSSFEIHEPVMAVRFDKIEEAACFCETVDRAAIETALSAMRMTLLIVTYGDRVYATVRSDAPTA